MKLLISVSILASMPALFAQQVTTVTVSGSGIANVTSLPATCTVGGANTLVLLTTGTTGLYRCKDSPANTFEGPILTSVTGSSGVTCTAGANPICSSDTAVMLSQLTAQAGTAWDCRSASASGTAYTCTVVPSQSAYTINGFIDHRPDVDCTGACSLSVNGIGALPIWKRNTSGALVATVSGDIKAKDPHRYIVHSTDGTTADAFVMEGLIPPTTAFNGTTVPTNSAADQVLVTTASAVGAWTNVGNCGDGTHALAYATSTHTFSCQAITAGGSPGGSTNDVQVNGGSGAFAGGFGVTMTHPAANQNQTIFKGGSSDDGTRHAVVDFQKSDGTSLLFIDTFSGMGLRTGGSIEDNVGGFTWLIQGGPTKFVQMSATAQICSGNVTNYFTSQDACLQNSTTGIMEINNTTKGTFTGTGLKTGRIQTAQIFTVATLPTCNAGAEGTRGAVSDLLTPTFLAAAVGGGTVHGSVYCNGTAWVTD